MKKWIGIIIGILVLFFASIFYRNITTYNSMKSHTGYTYGVIVKIWESKNSWYSRYQYYLNGKTFQGIQGKKYSLHDTVLIVYDSTAPRFSMIADYSYPIFLDKNNKIMNLDTIQVKYIWKD